MSVSLLYPSEIARQSVGTVGRDTLNQLAMRQFSARLELPRSDSDFFLDVLSHPLTNPDAISYRREILDAFLESPELLADLCETFDRLFDLKSDHTAEKRERGQLLRASSGEGVPGAALNLLRECALTLKRCLLLLDTAEKSLTSRTVGARGLIALSDALRKITDGPTLSDALALCTRFETLSEADGAAIQIRLNPSGGQIVGELTDRSRILFVRPDSVRRRFLFSKKDQPAPTPASAIDLRFFTLSDALRSDALTELSEQIDRMAGAIFSAFLPVGLELAFYRSALRYVGLLRERGASVCYADLGDALAFTDLLDPLLLSDRSDADKVIGNVFAPDSRSGVVVLGANGSGKTVWLRSVGLLQLLSQSGLPVPAKSAKIPIYRQIFTHFSASEKEFEAGNEAGRFEQEVREMAAIVEQVGENTLLLLNETFQTTAYAEGAEGLSHILRYLAGRGCRWMLTTHLTELPDFFAPDEVLLLRTDGSYRVRAMP